MKFQILLVAALVTLSSAFGRPGFGQGGRPQQLSQEMINKLNNIGISLNDAHKAKKCLDTCKSDEALMKCMEGIQAVVLTEDPATQIPASEEPIDDTNESTSENARQFRVRPSHEFLSQHFGPGPVPQNAAPQPRPTFPFPPPQKTA